MLGAQALLLGAFAVHVAVTGPADPAVVVHPPLTERRSTPPVRAVGTCLADHEVVPCARGHDAEVVALPHPGQEADEGLRRWTANAVCAREVAARTLDVAADLTTDPRDDPPAGVAAPSLTYASTYPDDEVEREDPRVECLLVAARRTTLTGSLTAGDLAVHRPQRLE